ncbi:MAG: DnaD domain protein [Lachnospiraceae bacterium]|nr:DnaD domain protein [Lachnospiraceae bacterium]
MNLGLKNTMSVNVTVVSNEFIDTYMAAANGEYVKVFLYLLRHEQEELTVTAIADALNHTEADVKRALSYWREAGVLAEEKKEPVAAEPENARYGRNSRAEAESVATAQPVVSAVPEDGRGSGLLELPEMGNSYERMQKLSEDEEFSVLLYAVQQYLGKTFTQIECEKFAYFYDGLGMSGELLEYLAEYCAGGGHTSIRYIEKVALNWYQMGIKTREEARDYTMRFSRDMSSVMKAFGITNRNPGTAEQEFMKKWFKEYGFDCSLVTEACNRTITATGSASFPYADKILTGWKENGVRMLGDVQELDKRRQMAKTQQERTKDDHGRTGAKKPAGGGNNRFKNFEERSYNYEDFVWEGMRKRQRGGSGDGTQ